ncbi:LysR family transcriptional regulator [Agrobacterium vitis]|uniref:Transcriptional regulator LysR family n=2 Tax=Rhizobium/Agrobacterium group TaxID=227290 RepID=B9K0N9_ALLAM|nr:MULTISPECIES: LysR substrate-binding domain-containing protein [Rhizobium/Agrobacterium group]ACM38437.1 transcriptional regulator LysR family [Allorhizobium ampelinum S4]MCF1445601.1 LysR family transcriptional regulator [Allorhizobium ampelinum]MCF1460614.1 LysR family transcriptional regulator [Allorhizobium ampelinum]MCF1491407.1 LysR family transcriptional regulator [Allorhizobium ampelinum]MUO26866.1 LysR family transcriptional regulator [Agrobacterium vitis]
MSEQAYANLDIRLMRTLRLLLTECSVSRTADLLGQAQPTVSLSLKRLRDIFQDPLLVRSGSALVPTERGLALRSAMNDILGRIDTHLISPTAFDPAVSVRHFRIVASNCLGTVFMPQLIGAITDMAPGISIDASPMPSQDDLLSGLSEGRIDAVIGNWPHPPEHLRIAPMLKTDIVCMVRSTHRFARRGRDRIRLDEYLEESHLSPTSERDAQFSPIDGRLRDLGVKRHIRATVPEYSIAPYVLARSDLVFTTGRHFAEQVAQTFPFAVLDAPVELGQMHFYTLWHDRKHHAPDQAWLRRMIKHASAEMQTLDRPGPLPLPPMHHMQPSWQPS